LNAAPFAKDIEDERLRLPSEREGLVTELVDAVRERHHVLLVGEPGVGKTSALRAVRQLWSRVHVRLSLGEAKPEYANEYIEHRLKPAVTIRAILSSDALVLVHEAAQGRLRDIDRIATLALKRAARRKLKIVDRELLGHVLDEDSRPNLR
jgi:type II secretory pathway predicted ATPase ExeA